MVVSTGQQLNGTWLTWKSFYYPDSSGPMWAYAVPTHVANQVNNGYALMIDMMIGQFWVLVFSFVIAVMLYKKNVTRPSFKDLMPNVWNGKDDFRGVVMDKLPDLCGEKDPKHVVLLSLVLLFLFALYCGQKAMSILVGAKVIIGTVAPVNPTSIYYPISSDTSEPAIAASYLLSTPWALRALGTATASIASLSSLVSVSDKVTLGTFNGTDQVISQVTYNYTVTGADMGLQKYPDLSLAVNGSCFTEYNWYKGPAISSDVSCLKEDAYYWFDNESSPVYLSALDGLVPMAFFKLGKPLQPGVLPTSNTTWAAVISSFGKTSYTAGTDAWYLTDVVNTSESTTTGAGYYVTTGRPALSCWEDNVWSYGGQTAPITNLSSLPGLGLSTGMQNLLTNSLSVPMVAMMSIYLGSSALISGSAALGSTIDASANSYRQDLQRLIVAAYVATTNVLTSTTLYPIGAVTKLDNDVIGSSGQVEDGVADFVVWTSDATALNMVVVITIPCILVGLFLLNFFFLRFTAMGKAGAMSGPELFQELIKEHKNANIIFGVKKGAVWDFPKEHHDEENPQGGIVAENTNIAPVQQPIISGALDDGSKSQK